MKSTIFRTLYFPFSGKKHADQVDTCSIPPERLRSKIFILKLPTGKVFATKELNKEGVHAIKKEYTLRQAPGSY